MKKSILVISISLCLLGCNINPNKEARIQELENKMLEAADKIDSLETRVKTLEKINEELTDKILDSENQ